MTIESVVEIRHRTRASLCEVSQVQIGPETFERKRTKRRVAGAGARAVGEHFGAGRIPLGFKMEDCLRFWPHGGLGRMERVLVREVEEDAPNSTLYTKHRLERERESSRDARLCQIAPLVSSCIVVSRYVSLERVAMAFGPDSFGMSVQARSWPRGRRWLRPFPQRPTDRWPKLRKNVSLTRETDCPLPLRRRDERFVQELASRISSALSFKTKRRILKSRPVGLHLERDRAAQRARTAAHGTLSRPARFLFLLPNAREREN